jgi:hypothetical protein
MVSLITGYLRFDMVEWLAILPAPYISISGTQGNNTLRRKLQSGRQEVRRYGSGAPDEFSVTFRILNENLLDFKNFYERTLNMGLNWFSADWIESNLGYSDHLARIVGYPKRMGHGRLYSEFSVTLHIKKTAGCWADTSWPELAI